MNELSISTKLLFFIHLKLHYLLIFMLVIFASLAVFNQRSKIDELIIEYKIVAKIYPTKKEIKQELNRETNYTREDESTISSDNPIRDVATRLESSIAALNVKNFINQSLSSNVFIMIPIIVSGIVIARYKLDYKYKTEKLFIDNFNVKKVILTDTITIFVISNVSLLLFLVLYYVIGIVYYALTPIYIPSEIILTNTIDYIKEIKLSNNEVIQFAINTSLTFIISTFAYCITKIFKNGTTSTAFVLIYMMMIPNMWKYDIKNIYIGFFTNNFNTNASTFVSASYLSFNNYYAVVFILLYLIVILLVTINIIGYRSKYN